MAGRADLIEQVKQLVDEMVAETRKEPEGPPAGDKHRRGESKLVEIFKCGSADFTCSGDFRCSHYTCPSAFHI